MSYNGPDFVNDGPPAINAANLNGMVEELEFLDAGIITRKAALASGDDLNNFGENGIYTIGAAARNNLINKPSDFTSGTGELICIKGTDSGTNLTMQILINNGANYRYIYQRLINNTTCTEFYGWIQVAGKPLQTTGNNVNVPMSQNAVTRVLDDLESSLESSLDDLESSMLSYKGQLLENDDLNNYGETGIYGFSGSVRSTLVHLPSNVISGTGTLICIKGSDAGTNVTTQILINNSANGRIIYERLINNSTHEVVSIYDWEQITYRLMQATGSNENVLMSQKAITDAINEIVVGSNTSQWANKTIVCFGDSRTWYDGHAYNNKTKSEWTGRTCVGYQQRIRDLLSATVLSEGVSGNTSKQICDRIRAYDFTNIDAVLLEGGVNDFVKSSEVTIGQIQPIGSTFDTTTVYGAWQSAIEYIMTNYPSVVIYMDIPAIAWLGSNDDVFPYNTAKIKAEIAELYNIPCKDLYKEAGINIVNRDYWYCDDVSLTNNWHLHFNDYGNYLLGSKLAEFMNSN